MLFKLLILSRIIIRGVFSETLYSSALIRTSSLFFSLRFFIVGKAMNLCGKTKVIVDKTQDFITTSFFKKAHFHYIYRLKNNLSHGEEGNSVNEAVQHHQNQISGCVVAVSRGRFL